MKWINSLEIYLKSNPGESNLSLSAVWNLINVERQIIAAIVIPITGRISVTFRDKSGVSYFPIDKDVTQIKSFVEGALR